MDRKEINQLLENIEEHVMQILETADLLDILCNAQCIDETGKYLYIITKYLKMNVTSLKMTELNLKQNVLNIKKEVI